MTCIQMDHDHVWETMPLLFSDKLSPEETVKYCYFVGSYENHEESDRRWVKWEDEDQVMELSFERSLYMEAFCLIQDRCDSKKVEYDF